MSKAERQEMVNAIRLKSEEYERIQQEKQDQSQFIAAMQQQLGQNDPRGLGSISGNNAAQGMSGAFGQLFGNVAQQVKPVKEKEGVLLWQGRELPEVWRGAEYKKGTRTLNVDSRQWKIEFRSDFSMDTIMLWLDPDKHSGEETDKIAATYLETIDQRRLG